MGRKQSSVAHARGFAVLVLCLSIPLITTWCVVQYLNRDIFYEQKGGNLISIAWMLGDRLGPGGYEEILIEYGVQDASREEQIAVLNAALRDVTDQVAAAGEGLGVGFYSRELDAIITYGHSADFEGTVGNSIAQDHPGRKVMMDNVPMVQTGTMVRGNIMNAMVPLERGGEVIGYIWANELVSDLEGMLNQATDIIMVLLVVAYLLMVAIVVAFFQKLMRAEKRSRDTVEEASREIQRVDGLMHIVNKAVSSLLSADEASFQKALQNCMEMMASAFEVDRLFIWKRGADRIRFRIEARWEDGPDSYPAPIGHTEESLPTVADWEGWVGQMAENQSVTRFGSKAPDEAGRWLDSFGIQSITTIPVFLQDDFWGFVSFSNCHKERGFTQDEEAILFSGSLLMANAVARNEMVQRLVLAREGALAGTKAKSAFLASMSHEMRTPMNAIIGMATIGKTAGDLERKDYAFRKIEDASVHLLGVINDVLDISKIESGKLELSLEEVSFEELLQRVVNVIDGRLTEKEQLFLVSIDEDIPTTLICDDHRLAQVITNLLANAIKFTPKGGSIWLDARLLAEKEGICTLQIDVSDNGIGLRPEQQERIFKSFEQAESSTTRKYGGTGLGLSISKNLVELMKGRLWVESQEGRGAKFSFTIQAPAGSRRHTASLPVGPDWKAMHFLLANGAEEVRVHFASMMESMGLQCDLASNAEETLALIRQGHRYDLCFVDWDVPGMDGLQLARRVKEETGTDTVLLATALEWDQKRSEAGLAGVKHVLAKPVFPSGLVGCLGKCLAAEGPKEDAMQEAETNQYIGRHILLAEDVEINGEILIALLEPTGVEIDWVRNGAQAVERFLAHPGKYDMIFMDVQMPEMDGHTATRTIRGLDVPGAKDIPIVAMTANVFKEDIEACHAAGMNDHMGKPLDMDGVLEKLRQYLHRGCAAL